MVTGVSARRRTVAVGSYSATAILAALIGVTTMAWQVAMPRVGAWLARGLPVPVCKALLADAAQAESYGRAL